MLAGKGPSLLGLLVDGVGCIGNVVVNELLVGLVNKRSNEENSGRDQRKTPEWDELDQVVGDECTEESLGVISTALAGIGI